MNAAIKGNGVGTPMPVALSTKLNRITERAKQSPACQFKNLAHMIDQSMLTQSFHELRKAASAGVDNVTVKMYEENLSTNIQNLHERLRSGQYRASHLRRVYIEKEDGKQRPLSIPVLEDKIAQRAVVAILNRIYEQDFLSCSYGYRPRRGPHQAVEAIQTGIIRGKANWVLDADIKNYFGSIVRKQLMSFLKKRIADKNLLRLIGKWLCVGVIDDGRLLMDDNGTYQGSVISPLLANVYLHEVLDLWVKEVVRPRLKGEIQLYRFADDFIVCFERREDAEKFKSTLVKRFAKYGLELHPDKTKLIEFGRYATQRRKGKRPETFTFLGFTFYCAKTSKGKFTVNIKTSSKRLARSIKRITEWCRKNRHESLYKQRQELSAMMRGHYQYYGRKSNFRSLRLLYRATRRSWKKWLGRRTRGSYLTWDRFHKIITKHPLPLPRITEGKSGQQLELWSEFI